MPEKHLTIPNTDVEQYEPNTPERALLVAVLERSICDVLNPPQSEGGSGKYNAHNAWAREAHGWLRSKSGKPFSFLWICHFLNLSPKRIRSAVYEYEAKGIRFEFNMHKTCVSWESKAKKRQPITELP